MFEAYSEDGKLQFNAELCAYYLAAKGTVVTSDEYPFLRPYDPNGSQVGIIPGVIEGDIVALSCSTGPVVTGIGYGGVPDIVVSNGTRTVTYYLFRKFNVNDPSSSGVGMEIYDPSSKVTFSTVYGGGKILRYFQRIPITSVSSGMNTFVSMPAGRTYAYVINAPSMRKTFETGGLPPGFNLTTNRSDRPPNGNASGIQSASNGFYIKEVPGFFDVTSNQFNGFVLAVDVSGY